MTFVQAGERHVDLPRQAVRVFPAKPIDSAAPPRRIAHHERPHCNYCLWQLAGVDARLEILADVPLASREREA